jgi:hypothetical protein
MQSRPDLMAAPTTIDTATPKRRAVMPVDPAPKTDDLVERLRVMADVWDEEIPEYRQAADRIEALEAHLTESLAQAERAQCFALKAQLDLRAALAERKALHAALTRARAEAFQEAARVAEKTPILRFTRPEDIAQAIRSLSTKGDQARPDAQPPAPQVCTSTRVMSPASIAQTPAEGGTRDG